MHFLHGIPTALVKFPYPCMEIRYLYSCLMRRCIVYKGLEIFMVSSRSNINISNLHGFRNRWVFFSRSLKNRARASMCVRQEQVHVLTMLMSFNQYIFLCIYVGTTNEIYHISVICITYSIYHIYVHLTSANEGRRGVVGRQHNKTRWTDWVWGKRSWSSSWANGLNWAVMGSGLRWS